ncbi:unnamed protein product [Tuber melanosporum]|uniref:(Perigord truffle) hypothetical protein n=1 Tax=Tuber melanosporum (strain Mel28) TaxID=656061 RepID=D5G5Y7_TUBMM|nr:unnamed protein product [Tuber melanosporum]
MTENGGQSRSSLTHR